MMSPHVLVEGLEDKMVYWDVSRNLVQFSFWPKVPSCFSYLCLALRLKVCAHNRTLIRDSN